MIDIVEYEQAVIVSSDGDFYSLVQYLVEKGKLKAVLSSDEKNCSTLLKHSAKDKLQYMFDLKKKLEYIIGEKKKSTT